MYNKNTLTLNIIKVIEELLPKKSSPEKIRTECSCISLNITLLWRMLNCDHGWTCTDWTTKRYFFTEHKSISWKIYVFEEQEVTPCVHRMTNPEEHRKRWIGFVKKAGIKGYPGVVRMRMRGNTELMKSGRRCYWCRPERDWRGARSEIQLEQCENRERRKKIWTFNVKEHRALAWNLSRQRVKAKISRMLSMPHPDSHQLQKNSWIHFQV